LDEEYPLGWSPDVAVVREMPAKARARIEVVVSILNEYD
jgi:hypothetical protein